MSSVNGTGRLGVGPEVVRPEICGQSENCCTIVGEARSMVKDVWRSDVSMESGGTSVPQASTKMLAAEGTGALERSEELSNNETGS